MIEETVFTKKEIVKVVKEKYDIKINKVAKLDRGSANIYSLNNNEYILKEFQSKYTTKEINKEIKIINHLKKDNIPVPEYMKTLNGKYSFTYKNKIIILQKYIDGYTMESNTANYNQMIESAEYLGKIIKSLSNLKIVLPSNDITSWYSQDTIEDSIEKHKKLLEKITKEEYPKIYRDLTNKIYMLKYMKNNFDFSDMNKLTIMNTHGDYSVLQFIYKDKKIESIIDFVSACKMPIVWEIIRSYSYIDSKAKSGRININNLFDYVKKVNEYIKLNEYDLKYMAYLYLIQILTSTFGYKQYINDNSKVGLLEFAFFRTKLCKFLFKNAEKISNTLEEINNNN